MMNRTLMGVLGLWLIAAASAGMAEADDLDRLQIASEGVARQMNTFLLSRVPDLAGILPPVDWQAEERAVARCTLDGIAAEKGAEGVEAYVAGMERWAAAPIRTMNDRAAAMPRIMTDDLVMILADQCGAMKLAERRAAESGWAEAAQRPEVMAALWAE
jgi:hypothetical protein